MHFKLIQDWIKRQKKKRRAPPLHASQPSQSLSPLSPPPSPSRPHTIEEIDEIFDERERRGIWGYGVFYNTITGRREVVGNFRL